MKKKSITIIALVFGLVSIVNAQIPNPGFENWYNSANRFDPVGWITSNATPFVSVVQATAAYQGTYAVNVKTWQAGVIIVSGICQSDGFNYSSRPTKLNGYVKCNVMPGDSVGIVITATLGGVNGVPVGAARQVYSSSISTYTAFSLPIYYGSAAATDTIYIDIYAGKASSPLLGTEIMVDELSLTTTTGIDNTNVPLSDVIGQNYPNPTKDFTIIPCKPD